MFLVELGLALIAFGGGLFLVAKAKAENLSGMFRLGAWLMIVVSLLIMLCVGARTVMRFAHHDEWGNNHEMMMDDDMYGHDGMHDGMMRDGMHGCKDGCDMRGGHKMMCSDSAKCDSMMKK
jgi:hypothetical protein